MFHSRDIKNTHLPAPHERCSNTLTAHHPSGEKEKSFSLHERNIQSLAILYILNLFHILDIEKDFVVRRIRNKVPQTIKMSSPLESFKSKIRTRKPDWKAAFAFDICTT